MKDQNSRIKIKNDRDSKSVQEFRLTTGCGVTQVLVLRWKKKKFDQTE